MVNLLLQQSHILLSVYVIRNDAVHKIHLICGRIKEGRVCQVAHRSEINLDPPRAHLQKEKCDASPLSELHSEQLEWRFFRVC